VGPLFITVQGNMNKSTITPSAFLEVQNHYSANTNVVFVRPDHYFQLLRRSSYPAGHRVFAGDFTGDGKTDMLMYYGASDNTWWLGTSDGSKLAWAGAGDSKPYGNMADNAHVFFTGDFNGDKKQDMVVFGSADNKWHLGASNGISLVWSDFAATGNFGNLLDGAHRIFTGDYDGDGKRDALFYYGNNGDWWLGKSNGVTLNWSRAANLPVATYGNLIDGSHLIFDGDFNGDGKADVLFLNASDHNWWMGISDGTNLTFHQAGNTDGYGNLADNSHRILTGDFTGDGKTDVLFYYSGNGDWFLGTSDGNQLTWSHVANSSADGNLMSWSHRLFVGDGNGDGKSDALYYNSDNGSFAFGLSNGSALNWSTASSQPAQGNLGDTNHLWFSGDFNGDGKTDAIFYEQVSGDWTLGLSNSATLTWQPAGNTKGFGDLTN
jgi:hypothetical protein